MKPNYPHKTPWKPRPGNPRQIENAEGQIVATFLHIRDVSEVIDLMNRAHPVSQQENESER